MLLLLVVSLATLISSGGCYSISKEDLGESSQLNNSLLYEDFFKEPTYQPRFLGLGGRGGGGGNNTLEKVVEVFQNPGNKTLQEHLANVASDLALKTFGGHETVKKLIEAIRNPGNKTLQENILDIAAEEAMKKFGDDEAVKKVFDILRSPDKATRQKILISLAADLALKMSKNDQLLKKVINLFENPENKTLQENILGLTAEVALRASKGDDLVKKVIEVFQNPENKTLQENILDLAAEVAIRKFGVDPYLKRVFDIIHNPGNKTFQDNLMDIALDIALKNAGVDETMRKVARTLLIPGKKSLQENLISLTSELVAQKGGKVFGDLLGKLLGQNTVAGAKEKVGAIGQAVKVGGNIFGGLLSKVGGNSILGKIGQAISGGSQKIGGVMSNIAGNSTAGNAIDLLGNALEGGNITIEDAFKQASHLIMNAGSNSGLESEEVHQVTNKNNGDDVNENDDIEKDGNDFNDDLEKRDNNVAHIEAAESITTSPAENEEKSITHDGDTIKLDIQTNELNQGVDISNNIQPDNSIIIAESTSLEQKSQRKTEDVSSDGKHMEAQENIDRKQQDVESNLELGSAPLQIHEVDYAEAVKANVDTDVNDGTIIKETVELKQNNQEPSFNVQTEKLNNVIELSHFVQPENSIVIEKPTSLDETSLETESVSSEGENLKTQDHIDGKQVDENNLEPGSTPLQLLKTDYSIAQHNSENADGEDSTLIKVTNVINQNTQEQSEPDHKEKESNVKYEESNSSAASNANKEGTENVGTDITKTYLNPDQQVNFVVNSDTLQPAINFQNGESQNIYIANGANVNNIKASDPLGQNNQVVFQQGGGDGSPIHLEITTVKIQMG